MYNKEPEGLLDTCAFGNLFGAQRSLAEDPNTKLPTKKEPRDPQPLNRKFPARFGLSRERSRIARNPETETLSSGQLLESPTSLKRTRSDKQNPPPLPTPRKAQTGPPETRKPLYKALYYRPQEKVPWKAEPAPAWFGLWHVGVPQSMHRAVWVCILGRVQESRARDAANSNLDLKACKGTQANHTQHISSVAPKAALKMRRASSCATAGSSWTVRHRSPSGLIT